VSFPVEPQQPLQEPTVRWPVRQSRGCAGRNGEKMPLFRYFIYVGGVLLTLLLVSSAVFPRAPLPETLTSGGDLPSVRILSDRKLPEKLVFDTRVPVQQAVPVVKTVVAAAPIAPAPVAASPAVAEMSAKARVREAFAQLPDDQDASGAKMSQMALVTLPQPKMISKTQQPKRKLAAPRASAPVMMVAQQPHFGQDTW
jgi:hypothetical protein